MTTLTETDAKKHPPIPIAPLLAVILVAFAIYIPAINNDFCFDDNNQVVGNPWIRGTAHLKEIFTQNAAGFDRRSVANYYRPMMYLTYIANYAVFGLQAWSYHLINILFHCTATSLVFLLTLRLLPPEENPKQWFSPAFFAALIFAAHPIHTEAVMWISALPDTASTFFYIASFYLYILSKDGQRTINWKYILSLLLFSIAILYKEIAVTLPAIIVLYDILERKENNRTTSFYATRYIPYMLTAVIYMTLRLNALKELAPAKRFTDLTAMQHLYNCTVLFAQYIKKIFIPADLTAYHAFHPATTFNSTVFLSIITTAVSLFLFFILRQRKPLALGLGIFLLPLLPALYLPALGENPFTERYLYLPSIGFSIIAGTFLASATSKRQRQLSSVTLSVILAIYSITVTQRAPAWANEITLWSSAIKCSAGSATPHRYLGYALDEHGRTAEAIEEYKAAIRIEPDNPYTHLNLGIAYQKAANIDAAIWEYAVAIRIKPNFNEAFTDMGTAYASRGQYDLALRSCDEAIKIFADDAAAHECKGTAYGNIGAFPEAIQEFEIAFKLMPYNRTYQENLQKAYQIVSSRNKQ